MTLSITPFNVPTASNASLTTSFNEPVFIDLKDLLNGRNEVELSIAWYDFRMTGARRPVNIHDGSKVGLTLKDHHRYPTELFQSLEHFTWNTLAYYQASRDIRRANGAKKTASKNA